MKHVIVGDGVAGHTAAEEIRAESEDADIHVFTREEVPFYDRIGLRDYVRGGRNRDDLVFNDGADWYRERGIDLHLGTEVVDIDPDAQVVETADGETFDYDRLLLAVGGTPRTLPMEDGVDHVHHLWTLAEHGKPLRRDLEQADKGVVIGGGLLGFDLIGSFARSDTEATYLIREDNWWSSTIDPDAAEIVHAAMRDHGIDLRTGEEASDLANDGEQVVVTTDRDEYTVDVVGMAIGHVRHLDLAEAAGLDTDRGILCDGTLRTSDPHIYTAGDVAEYRDAVLEKRNMGGSWVTAQKQGEVAGRNMTGKGETLEFVDTYTVNHFGLNVASLGDPVNTDGKQVVHARGDGRYRKVVIDGDRIVGAAILGEMKWMHPLKQLIEGKVDVSAHFDGLEDPEFDLRSLL